MLHIGLLETTIPYCITQFGVDLIYTMKNGTLSSRGETEWNGNDLTFLFKKAKNMENKTVKKNFYWHVPFC